MEGCRTCLGQGYYRGADGCYPPSSKMNSRVSRDGRWMRSVRGVATQLLNKLQRSNTCLPPSVKKTEETTQSQQGTQNTSQVCSFFFRKVKVKSKTHTIFSRSHCLFYPYVLCFHPKLDLTFFTYPEEIGVLVHPPYSPKLYTKIEFMQTNKY